MTAILLYRLPFDESLPSLLLLSSLLHLSFSATYRLQLLGSSKSQAIQLSAKDLLESPVPKNYQFVPKLIHQS
ncbi:hypothetical protein V1508DRAFT_423793 [Lipomyces doorenjongii]|uniref:uncharacterized protein n=1 Tax=Lipomyces doorenjongii TaxID=383834 RepID=UPI0034CD482A